MRENAPGGGTGDKGGRGRLPGLLHDGRRHGRDPLPGPGGGDLGEQAAHIHRPELLVIDDVGLLPMDREAAAAFFQVISHRYDKAAPTLVTTNRSLPGWGAVFGDDVVASAVLDRILHRAVVLNIKGPSWRMREHQALAEIAGEPAEPTKGSRRDR